ncbi:MAG: AAA family ATPase [Bacteroidales bacterium]|nr:AAA family ATPase [Bacteroidales bacterium]
MLLRFVIKNLYSFKEQTEFNLFPSSRAAHHQHHRIKCDHAEALRFSSIYGANGAGKSNLVKALNDFQIFVSRGTIGGNSFQPYKFQLAKNNLDEPVSMAVEFCHENTVYYYSIEIDTGMVSYESLSISNSKRDKLVFERRGNGKQSVVFGDEYLKDKKKQFLFTVIQEKLLHKEELLLCFMANAYPDEVNGIKEAYFWILNKLIIVRSDGLKNLAIAHIMDTNPEMMSFLTGFLPSMKTGITGMSVVPTEIDEQRLGQNWAIELKKTPGIARSFSSNYDTRINSSVVYEDGKFILKELQPYHRLSDGTDVKMPINFESDGTIRLIEYVPVLYLILNQDCTVVIDEIERSLHPILIKEIIKKLSESKVAKGQLVFTTHESCLLDQEILRPDEIWFAQKDQDQATQLYPLSDFSIHKTASIENGYLNGRYGGIPFLSNLNDLKW